MISVFLNVYFQPFFDAKRGNACSLRTGISPKMKEFPVKSTSQSTSSRMERTFSLSFSTVPYLCCLHVTIMRIIVLFYIVYKKKVLSDSDKSFKFTL